MKHRITKRKFGFGYDANKMLMRQLCTNFFVHNSLVTTKHKAKAAQRLIERCVTKAKEKKESNKNYLLKYLGQEQLVDTLFSKIGPAFKSIKGGYTKTVLLEQRKSDGALMAKITWAHPVVSETIEKKKEEGQSKESKPQL